MDTNNNNEKTNNRSIIKILQVFYIFVKNVEIYQILSYTKIEDKSLKIYQLFYIIN